MNYADLNGGTVRYTIEGEGEPRLVLLHEMGGSLESWDEVVPILAPHFTILRYDFRGAGMSERIRGEVTAEGFADDLVALLDHVGWTAPVALAGVAVGAAIALCTAGRYPERVSSLAVMSPAVDCKPEDRPARLAWIDTIAPNGMRSIAEGALGAGYPAVLRERNPARFEKFRARWIGNDPESFAATYRMLVHMDIAAYISAIRCPTLGIGGTLDTFRPPDYVRGILAPIPGLEMAVIETSHHQPTETPEEVAAKMLDFFSRHSNR